MGGGVYDEVDLADLTWDAPSASFTYPCPCGDVFRIGLDALLAGEDVAGCASCTLRLRVVADDETLERVAAEVAAAQD